MTRTQVLQEIRRMRFEEAYGGWQARRLTQEEAARLLGGCERTVRRAVRTRGHFPNDRAAAIRRLANAGAVQLSLFDETDLIELRSDDFPGERLMVCRNPRLAERRARKREEMLCATEGLLDRVAAATQRRQRPLKGADRIALRVGKGLGK